MSDDSIDKQIFKQKTAHEESTSAEIEQVDVLNHSYNNSDNSLLLEQYRLYVEMLDKISERRGQANNFYISLLSATLALLSILGNKDILPKNKSTDISVILLGASILGIALCFLWYFNIRGYALLVKRKIQVIHEMERYLPFSAYSRESTLWNAEIKREAHIFKPIRISRLEQFIAICFGTVFFILLIYSSFNLLN